MEQSQSRLAYLFRQYASDQHTESERLELMNLVRMTENAEELNSLIEREIDAGTIDKTITAQRADEIFHTILSAKEQLAAPVIKLFPWKRVAAAVAIILLSLGGYFYFNSKPTKQIAKTNVKQFKNDIAPGGNKAVLTLANGKQIILDSAANGTLTQQGNTKVIKLDSGQLAYQSVGHPELVEGYNTITTPRGGQYQIVLADGSKVWLNAASSLKYPAAFSGKKRKVELTGEGYFEVAHNATKPFKVAVNGIEVQVLGTHFNINAYADEADIKTTLLEGSVKVTNGSTGKVIKPGEQAQVSYSSSAAIIVQPVDVDAVVAWQKGLFEFNNTDLRAIMRQVSRWYDVDVVYESKPGDAKFGGGISKNLPLSRVLKLLEANGVKCKLEGKVIRVIP